MCRMIVGAGNVSVDELADGLLRMASKGEHCAGWGMAWVDDGRMRWYKSVVSCLDDPELAQLRRVQSPLVIMHARKSRTKIFDETHPWVRSVEEVPYAFCYNGSFNFDGPDTYRPLGFVNDVFSFLRPGHESEALHSVLGVLKKIRGVNMVLARPNAATISVRYAKRHDYNHYQMALSAGNGHVIISSEPVREVWTAVGDRALVKVGTDGAYEIGRLQ